MNVLRVAGATVRGHIENFTKIYCVPHEVKFIRTPALDWVVPLECLQNAWIESSKQELKQYLIDNSITPPEGVRTVKDALNHYGTIIDVTW